MNLEIIGVVGAMCTFIGVLCLIEYDVVSLAIAHIFLITAFALSFIFLLGVGISTAIERHKKPQPPRCEMRSDNYETKEKEFNQTEEEAQDGN